MACMSKDSLYGCQIMAKICTNSLFANFTKKHNIILNTAHLNDLLLLHMTMCIPHFTYQNHHPQSQIEQNLKCYLDEGLVFLSRP